MGRRQQVAPRSSRRCWAASTSTPASARCPEASDAAPTWPGCCSRIGTSSRSTSPPTTWTCVTIHWLARTSQGPLAATGQGAHARSSPTTAGSSTRSVPVDVGGPRRPVIDPFEGGYSAYILQRVERDRHGRMLPRRSAVETWRARSSPWLSPRRPARAPPSPSFVSRPRASSSPTCRPCATPLELKRLAASPPGQAGRRPESTSRRSSRKAKASSRSRRPTTRRRIKPPPPPLRSISSPPYTRSRA